MALRLIILRKIGILMMHTRSLWLVIMPFAVWLPRYTDAPRRVPT